ncbi:uncharacterized [Tachysurus ichikawai]
MPTLQCPVDYYPVKQKGGAGFGHEHHLSLLISPKQGINEGDNCLFIFLAPAPNCEVNGRRLSSFIGPLSAEPFTCSLD